MIIKTTEELTDFTSKKLKKTGLNHNEIALILGIHESSVSKAVQNSEKNNSSKNGIRRRILNWLGFEVSTIYEIKRLKRG